MTPVGPAAEPLQTSRLVLEPLTVRHAREMVQVLAAPQLYQFTGGNPATLAELTERYQRLAAGPPPPRREGWLNWVIRQREDQRLVGTVQATVTAEPPGSAAVTAEPPGSAAVTAEPPGLRAAVAWVVGAPWQGCGYATESAQALVSWLRERGVVTITAAIHPGHAASAAVARRAGLVPTAEYADGEVVWRLAR
jgi:RimJ/RimL family protein N-acetyltransferase